MKNMAREKITVEAEQNGPDHAILTVKDMTTRRRLKQRFGQHKVRLTRAKLKKIGFPQGSLKDIDAGRPVRFKMNPDGFIVLLESVS